MPAELLLHTLSFLTFNELLPVLAVSKRWRNFGIDSTPYWSFIKLRSLRVSAVKLFVTRISRARGPWRSMFTLFLDGGLRHHRSWDVRMPHSDAPALWNSLDVAAPQLRSLSVRGARRALAGCALGRAPDIRAVSLMNVDLPGQPVLVFSGVSKLDLEYETPIPDIFRHFPALETIEYPYSAVLVHPALHTARSYRTVRKCVWGSGRVPSDPPLPLAPTRDVEFVSIYSPRAEEIIELVGHLRAPISLTYRPCPVYPTQAFELLFVEADADTTARSRLIIDVIEAWLDEVCPELQPALCTALAGRLHTLEIDAAHWETFVRCMPAVLSGVRRVRITVPDEGTITALPRVKVEISDLRTLELVAARCMWISESDIIDFAVASHDAAALGKTTLVLYNIHLGESVLGLGFFFKDVQLVHSAACSP